MNTNIPISENRLAAFCKANGITRLALFGSVLRDDFGPDCDVDVLVEFDPERVPGLLGVAAMEASLRMPNSGAYDRLASLSSSPRLATPDSPTAPSWTGSCAKGPRLDRQRP